MNSSSRIKNILIVDDDPVFRAVARRTCSKYRFNPMVCASLRELQTASLGTSFDVVIMDYFLDNLKHALTGVEIANLVEHVPIILVSTSDHCIDESEAWPASIRAFYNKRVGADAILKAARLLSERRPESDRKGRSYEGQ
jgi:DNA-binding NarL/FixJ family response regulator